jgi:hypothetical protein
MPAQAGSSRAEATFVCGPRLCHAAGLFRQKLRRRHQRDRCAQLVLPAGERVELTVDLTASAGRRCA